MPWTIPDSTGQLWRIDVGADAGGAPIAVTPVAGTVPPVGGGGTYTVNDALNLAKKLAKGVPFTGVDTTICDMVSAGIYKSYPWRDTLQIFTPGTFPLADSLQDYPVNLTTIMRITQFWIVRNDVTPKAYRDVRVAKSLPFDQVPTSPYSVRSAAYQAGINSIRLEKAVRVPAGSSWEIGGEFQPHPTKITDLDQTNWFADEYLEVLASGLAYWAYRMADDKRAGDAVKIGDGRVQYSGQLAMFMDAVQLMREAEDFGNIDTYYPDDSFGSVDGRRWYANDLFPYMM